MQINLPNSSEKTKNLFKITLQCRIKSSKKYLCELIVDFLYTFIYRPMDMATHLIRKEI